MSDSSNLPSSIAQLPVAVDAMGGDFGPQVVIKGAVLAAREYGIKSILVGKESELKNELAKQKADKNPDLTIFDTPDVITMQDSPSLAIRGKENSSIRKAFELVTNGIASSVVSPGNTGAFMAAGVYLSGTLSGIARPAIASLIPNVSGDKPSILLDSGANLDCHAYQLVQFALMGSYYAKSVLNCESPRVAILSNGAELSKGTDIIRSAALMLSEFKGINFIGYIEGRDVGHDKADVIVCDGFVGNIVLKTMEGTAELVLDSIKQQAEHDFFGRLGMWIAKPMLKALFQKRLDPSSYGGAPLLGLNNVAIVCHGSSNEKAIMNGIRVAQQFVNDSLVTKIAAALNAFELKVPRAYDNSSWGRVGQRFEKRKIAANAENATDPIQDGNMDKAEGN